MLIVSALILWLKRVFRYSGLPSFL